MEQVNWPLAFVIVGVVWAIAWVGVNAMHYLLGDGLVGSSRQRPPVP